MAIASQGETSYVCAVDAAGNAVSRARRALLLVNVRMTRFHRQHGSLEGAIDPRLDGVAIGL